MTSNQRDIARHDDVPLLQAHFARIARRLKAEGEAAKSFDHGTNRGQIREAFIRELLSANTSPLTGIGTGEIIHSGSTGDKPRRQFDVVIHNNRYPKVSLATGIDLFFVETVSSFVEIKSRLTKDHIRQAASATREVKAHACFDRQRLNPAGVAPTPTRPYSFVFAYDGPTNVETILGWMRDVSSDADYNLDALKRADAESRYYFNHLFVDGVFVLGTGFVCLDALPFESRLGAAHGMGLPATMDEVWVHATDNELGFLWLLINELGERHFWTNAPLWKYLGSLDFSLTA